MCSQGEVTDGEVVRLLLAELCKHKGALIASYLEAEMQEEVKGALKKQSSSLANVAQLRRAKSTYDDGAGAEDSMPRPLLSYTSHSTLGLDEAGRSRMVNYDTWVGVLVAYFPEYAQFWRQYGPLLVGSAAMPPLSSTGGRPVATCRVAYMHFLHRYQVQIAYDTFDDFSTSMLR